MIKQGEDALEALFGGRSQPAKIPDTLQAFGENVLEEAVQELFDGQAQGAGLAILAVAIGEGDVGAVIGEDAFGTEGRAVNVSG